MYASYKKVGLISSSSTDTRLNDKRVYNNLIRPGVPSYSTIGNTIGHIMDNFNWRTLALITLDIGGCAFALNSINQVLLQRNDIKVSDRIIISQESNDDDIKEALKRISERARSIIIIIIIYYFT